MSDEDEELSEHERLQRMVSPELQLLDLISKLEQRITRGEERAEQRTEFILEQHAQLTSKVDALADTQARAAETWARTESSIRALLAIQELQAGEIKDLTTAVRSVDERQRHTDDRLDVLINTVERYIAGRGNGNGQG